MPRGKAPIWICAASDETLQNYWDAIGRDPDYRVKTGPNKGQIKLRWLRISDHIIKEQAFRRRSRRSYELLGKRVELIPEDREDDENAVWVKGLATKVLDVGIIEVDVDGAPVQADVDWIVETYR